MVMGSGQTDYHFQNWAKTYSCQPQLYFEPRSSEEICSIIKDAAKRKKKVKVVGAGHSPSKIACTDDYMISLKYFNQFLELNEDQSQFTAQAGILLTDVNAQLARKGFALSLLPSISEVTLGGAIATGTHGTGLRYPTLSSYVVSMTLLTAEGELLEISRKRKREIFLAAACNLGLLGIVLSVTMKCEKVYNLEQTSYSAKFDDVLESLKIQTKASEHARILWYPYVDNATVYHVKRTSKNRKNSWFWSYLIGYHLLQLLYWISSFIPRIVPTLNRCYHKLFFSKRTEIVDVSHKIFNIECLFQQYVSEWAIPIENTVMAMLELRSWIENSKFPAHFPIEIRFARRDDEIYLNPTFGRDTCYINIIMYRPYNVEIERHTYWKEFSRIMLAADGRPHWAKDHDVSRERMATLYPEWETFVNVRKKLDPSEIFLNPHMKPLFGDV